MQAHTLCTVTDLDASEAAQLGAVGTNGGIAQSFHADIAAEQLGDALEWGEGEDRVCAGGRRGIITVSTERIQVGIKAVVLKFLF